MLTTLLSILLASQGPASLDLHPLPSGAMQKAGFYVPQRLELSPMRPANLSHVPDGAALFGSWKFGGKSYPTVEVQASGTPKAIVIDFSGKGDFKSSSPISWTTRPGPNGLHLYMTQVMAPCPIGGKQKVQVMFYRFDPADPQRPQLKNSLLYYGDYALNGTIKLGGKSYAALIVDIASHGDFDADPAQGVGQMGTATLLIDRDGDGKFRSPYETYNAAKPFNIAGTTYEIVGLHGNGLHAGVVKSAQSVAEIPIPPSLLTGKKVIAFTAKDRSGKTVHFPDDFKGKVVMLDFWATWCGPCMGEVPNVVKVYNQLHPQGFEILGVSLDNAQTISKIESVTKQNGMTWDQIADGKFWDAEIAKLYGIQSIPAAYIVDGTTGTILAEGESIRGENLLPAVQKALSGKTHE